MSDLGDHLLHLIEVRLLDPLEILLEDDEAVAGLRQRLTHETERWAESIEHGNAGSVRTIVRLMATLYSGDQPFAPDVDWWRAPLGQAVVRTIGHPYTESVSLATAGAMLGISRQGVHDLVRRGRLPRHPDGGVPVAAIRDRLRGPPAPDPVQADPVQTDPVQTGPAQTGPVQTGPVQAGPVQAGPVPDVAAPATPASNASSSAGPGSTEPGSAAPTSTRDSL
ncbi:hypothetical protein [Actinoplanes sp. NBRC 101535]|uniref:hypothetical protein n=1 Tax=Actinoplanes sp. NBRC 101535 TaxID=3032196 RepID=UPI0024A3DBA3|nr:hypothetical protein [Actinoplanes sp. NBRC 101535]GLY04737.1 hypothetical protein Acsp01_51160 [Actinoplanes sp. NBRC 101535]